MWPKDNPDSWRRIHEFIVEYPDDADWSRWKAMAAAVISALEERGLASSFRVGQAMHHIVFSTLDHHRLTTEPRVILELHPRDGTVRVAYSYSNLSSGQPVSEETLPVDSAPAEILRYLRRLWEETKDEKLLPDALASR